MIKTSPSSLLKPPGQEAAWDGKKQFRLGSTIPEACEIYAKRVKRDDAPMSYIHQLLDKYLVEVVSKAKSACTRVNKLTAIPRLKKVFGHMRIEDLTPADCYQYASKRKHKNTGNAAITAAHRELEVLSHAYTWAVMWGVLKAHPRKKELRLEGELAPQKRNRYVENWELAEALSLKPYRKKGSVRMIQAYIRVKLRTGLRMTDLLLLRQSDCREDGLHVQASKTSGSTGIRQVFTWVDEEGRDTGLKAAIDEALATRPVDIAPFVFCTDEGACYLDEQTGRAEGFSSVWQRFMDRVLVETSRGALRRARHPGQGRLGLRNDRAGAATAWTRRLENHAQALPAQATGRAARQDDRLN